MTEDTNTVAEAPVADAPVLENVEVAPEAQTEVEAPSEAPAVTADAPVEAPAEESAATADAVVAEENTDVVKSEEAFANAVTDIKSSLTNAFGDLAATIKSINDQVAELTKSLSTVTTDVTNVAKEVADVKGNFNEFGKRVDAVEQDTAFRKSGDLGEIVQEFSEMKTQKSLWGGRFLKNSDLFN
jgi:archaellum component FlaC